ncbi:MAG: phosphonate C-P lyase system protein PhnG [Clostridiaceae bacterium]|nr:phosphonate C-P lyase system protein PhnG [Clostridiaceae bacterium]
MKRGKRTEIFIEGSIEIAKQCVKAIEDKYDIELIEAPNHGLVMVKVREGAEKSLFYLGEVFVTEAKVKINDALGIGIVTGDKKELAYALAVIDAAYNANLQETREWHQVLLEEENRLKEAIKAKRDKVLVTKVNFETMDI